MWIGVVVILLGGTPQGMVEVFSSKQACEMEVAKVKARVEAKNHPEVTFLHGKCEEVK